MSAPPPIPPKPSELQDNSLPVVPPSAAAAAAAAAAPPAPTASASAAAPRPVNQYTRRLAATLKACFVCHRPSPVVLVSASLPNQDFFYTCASHLSDRHFATRIETSAPPATPPPPPTVVSPEEIEKVKREYEAKKAAKQNKAPSGEDHDKAARKDPKASWFGSTVGSLASTVASIAVPSLVDTPPSPEKPANNHVASSHAGTHEKYALDRSYFAMRTELLKKRDAARRMRALHMPSAPSRAVGP